MTNYISKFLSSNNRQTGDRFYIGNNIYTVITDETYTNWFSYNNIKIPKNMMLDILAGLIPLVWETAPHFGPYDKY